MKYRLSLIISVIILLLVVVNLLSKEEKELKTDTLIAYIDGRKTNTIPTKSNDITVDRIECDNNATATWNNEDWGIFINSITNNSTKCSVYFKTFPAPELYQGLIPVTYDNNGNTVVADTTTTWYDYDNHMWANAVLGTSSARAKSPGDTLSSSEILQYYVWIPRFKYQLFNANAGDLSLEQMINIEFEYKGRVKSNGTTNGNWLTHPAFTFGNTELNGIWVGKFEVTGSLNDQNNHTNLTTLPNAAPSTHIKLGDMFSSVREIDTSYSSDYGLDSNEIDLHLMKNMDWGAMAYLTNSKYGRYNADGTCVSIGCEVWVNPNSDFITGCAGNSVLAEFDATCNEWYTTLGVHSSSTDNKYGVYGMSGGTSDTVMSNVSKVEPFTFTPCYSGFTSAPLDKYMDKYFNLADSNLASYNGKLGDATREVISTIGNLNGAWNGNHSYFITSDLPFFLRGGAGNDSTRSGIGIFAFARTVDNSRNYNQGFRIVLTLQDGNYNGNGLE